LASYLRKKRRASYEAERRNKFELYIEELALSLNNITGVSAEEIKRQFTEMSLQVTAGADFDKIMEEEERKAALRKAKKAREEDE
jgi:DNA topoisomerase VI subunit B